MKINSLTIDFMGNPVTLLRDDPEWPTGGELWELATYPEAGKVAPTFSNFCAVTLYQNAFGSGGQKNWILLKGPEMDLINRINGITDTSQARWRWLVAPAGSIYLTLDDEDEHDATQLRWPRIAIGSKADGERNLVRVIGAAVDRKGNTQVRIAGIPKSTDYVDLTPQNIPWAFHNIYCIYQKLRPDEPRIGYTPHGIMYMPIFDPGSGFKVSKGPGELWIDAIWLKRRVD